MARLFPRLWNCLVNRGTTMDRRRPIAARRRPHVRPCLEALENRLTPAQIIWDNGGNDGLWENPLNWENDTLPGASDGAVIGSGYTIVNNLASTSIASFACSSPITFNGTLAIGNAIMSYIEAAATFYGELSLGGTLLLGSLMAGGGTFNADVHIVVGAELQLSAGTYTFADGVDVDGDGLVKVMSAKANIAGAVSFAKITLFNTMSEMIGSGTATIKDTMRFEGGKLDGTGTLKILTGAQLNLLETPEKNFIGWTVDNEGTTNWTLGHVVSSGSTFNNKLAAIFNLNEFAGNWTATGGSFENAGTFNSSGMEHVMAIEFNSTNLLHVLSGALTLTQGGEFEAVAQIDAQNSLIFGGGSFLFNPALAIQGAGFAIQNGATAIVFGTVTAQNYELRTGSLRGTGTLSITQTFAWTGGVMEQGGITRVESSATMTINNPSQNNITYTQDARLLEINGPTNWNASSTWALQNGARVTNNSTINVLGTTGNSAIFNADGAVTNRFVNNGTIEYVNKYNHIAGVAFENHGTIRLKSMNSASLDFTAPRFFLSGGPIEAELNTTVRFNSGTYSFTPDTDVYLLRGDGWFVALSPSRIVCDFDPVLANNFRLAGGTVSGVGAISFVNLLWTGGTMDGAGMSIIPEAGNMTIDGDVTLEARWLVIEGSASWQKVENFGGAGIFTFADDAEMRIDGTFSIVQEGGTIADDGTSNIIVRNGGRLEKGYTELPGETVIQVAIQNQGGDVAFYGDVTVQANFTQTLAAALLELGTGTYKIARTNSGGQTGPVFSVQAGTMKLQGGNLYLSTNNLISNMSNATFEGSGTLYGCLTLTSSQFHMTGNFTVSGTPSHLSFGNNTLAYLHGFNLLGASSGWVHLDMGSITYTGGGQLQGNIDYAGGQVDPP